MKSNSIFHPFLALALLATPFLLPVQPAMAQQSAAKRAVKPAVKSASWVELQARTDKRRYVVGEPIRVKLQAINIEEKDAYLKFSSGQRFDFKVFKTGQKEPAYVWSATRMFTMATGVQKLKMAQHQTYQAEIGDEMGQLAPGNYRLEAQLSNSSQIRALPITFTIAPKTVAAGALTGDNRATLSARTDKRVYQLGEEVKVDFSLQNNATQATTFNFGSGQTYDVFIKNAAGEPVWNWSANLRFMMVTRPITLAANAKQEFSVLWNGRALPDRQITPGKYTVEAVYTSNPPIKAAPIAIEIRAADAPNIALQPEAQIITTPSGLKYQDLTVGTGAVAVAKQNVTVNYRGTLENGTLFDQSYGRAPFEFLLDGGQVIRGWDEGVQGMKIGGKRRLIIPANLGYGATGTPGGPIPPNATLIFEVELLKVG